MRRAGLLRDSGFAAHAHPGSHPPSPTNRAKPGQTAVLGQVRLYSTSRTSSGWPVGLGPVRSARQDIRYGRGGRGGSAASGAQRPATMPRSAANPFKPPKPGRRLRELLACAEPLRSNSRRAAGRARLAGLTMCTSGEAGSLLHAGLSGPTAGRTAAAAARDQPPKETHAE